MQLLVNQRDRKFQGSQARVPKLVTAWVLTLILVLGIASPTINQTANAQPAPAQSQPAPTAAEFVIETVDGRETVTAWNGTSTDVVIPDGVQAIAARVFYNKGLTSVRLPESLTLIGDSAFQRNQITSIEAANLDTLGAYAFNDNQLTSFTAPKLESTGDYALANNKLAEFSQSGGTIGVDALANNSLTSVDIAQVSEIGSGAFRNNSLSAVQLSNPVTLGTDVFASNGQWVIVRTDDPSVTSQISTTYEFGHVVNPATLTVEFIDVETGAKITADRVFGHDSTQQMYSVGDVITFQAPRLDGYRAVNETLTVTFNSANERLVVEYEAQNDRPELALRDSAHNNKIVTVAPGSTADEAFLLGLVKATDLAGRDISDRITVNPTSVDTSTAHSQLVTYSVTDDFGNTAILEVTIVVGTDLLGFELGGGWTLGDFEYYGNSVIGFDPESYQNKLASNPNIVLPHINPYTGEPITDIAGKATTWTCANEYQIEWVQEQGYTCDDVKQWFWIDAPTGWNGRASANIGNTPADAKLDGADVPISTDNVVPFNSMARNVTINLAFYPGNQIQTISSSAFAVSSGVVILPGGATAGAVNSDDIRKVDFSNAQALREIGNYAFMGYHRSAGPLDVSNMANLQSIGTSAFSSSSASEVLVSNNPSLVSINDTAFYRNWVDAVTIADNPALTTIGPRAFDAVNQANSVTTRRNPSLATIGSRAFRDIYHTTNFVCEDCDALTTIPGDLFGRSRDRDPKSGWQEIDFTSAPNLDTSTLGSSFVNNATGHPDYQNKVVIWVTEEIGNRTPSRYNYLVNPCPSHEVPTADQPANWQASDFVYDVNARGEATVLGFSGCGAMKATNHRDVVLPATDTNGNPITGIASNAFAGTSIRNFDASNATALRDIAGPLTGNKDLVTVNLSGTQIETVPASLIAGNRSLTSINLSNTPLREIPDRMFTNLPNLTEVDVTGADQIARIGDSAFLGVKRSITGFELAALPALTEIAANAFKDTAMVTEADFSHNPALTTIGDSAFEKAGLQNIAFDNPALTTIGSNAFKNNKISELDLGKTIVTTIGADAFAYNQITEARIPNTLEGLALNGQNQSPFHDNPGVNDYKQVILRTPDGVNPPGPADRDYKSDQQTATQVNDGWLINPIVVTVEARLADDNSLLRSTQLYVAEDRPYTNPGIGAYVPQQDVITLAMAEDNYSVTVPYRLVSTDHINDNFGLRQDNYRGISRYEIGEEMLTWLYFDATGINTDESGLVLEVYYDPQFMVETAIQVPPSDFLKSSDATADNGVLRIPMQDHISGGTSLGIPVSWMFKELQTPQEYRTELAAVLRNANGDVLQIAEPVSLTGFYVEPALKKQTNGADINGTINADPALAVNYDVLGDGHVTYSFRLTPVERYIGGYTLTDKLPTYRKAVLNEFGEPTYSGTTLITEEATAVFDPEKNPEWTLSADGTAVTYAQNGVHTTAPTLPSLTLSFPHAETQRLFTNAAHLELVPHNRPDHEPVITLDASTGNQFNLEVREVPWFGTADYEMRAVSPHVSRELGTYMYDVQTDREKGIDWVLRGGVGKKVLPSGEVVEDATMTAPVFKYYDYDERLQMDSITAGWAGTVQALDAARNPVGTPISFVAGERVMLPDSWRRGPGIQIAADPALSWHNQKTQVTVHTSLRDPDVDHFDRTPGSNLNAFNADSSLTFQRTDHTRGDQISTVDRTDPASVTLRELIQRVGIDKTTSYPQNTSLRSDAAGTYTLRVNHSAELPELAQPVQDVVVVDVLPPYMTVDSVNLSAEFAAAGGTYESYFLPAHHENGNQQVLVFTAPSVSPDRDMTTEIATISTHTNIQMDGQVLNEAYLGWSNHDKIDPMVPNEMRDIADNSGNALSTDTLRAIGIDENVGTAGEKNFQWDRVSFNLTKVKELSARKFIRESVNDSWTTDGVITDPGAPFQYRLSLTNRMAADAQDPVRTGMEYYDVLPVPGDVGITTGEDRQSRFQNTLVNVQAPDGYDVWYTTETIDMTQFGNQMEPDRYLPTLNWIPLTGDVPDGTVATAVRIKARDTVTFGPGEVLNFDFNMRAATDESLIGLRAWNSYVRADDSSNRLLEPNRVWNEIGRPDSSIELRKMSSGANGEPLNGAVFGLYTSDGSWVATATSNSAGIVRFEGVNSNLDYEIRELKAPVTQSGAEYRLLDAPIKVTSQQLIDARYSLTLGDVENELPWEPLKPVRGAVELEKVNQNGDPLQGVQFRLTGEFSFASLIQNGFNPSSVWDLNDQMQIDMIASSNRNGRVVFDNLPMGRYQIQEINNPNSFYHGDWSRTVTLTNRDAPEVSPRVVLDGSDAVVNDTVQVRITKLGILNPEKADIDWQNLQGLDGVKLEGASFDVIDVATSDVVASGTTDSTGLFLAQGLKPDTLYELRETATPHGFDPYDGDPIRFQITSDNRLLDGSGEVLPYQRIYVPNDRTTFTSSVTVRKVDSANHDIVVPGATFELQKRNDAGNFEPYSNAVIPANGQIVTDADGIAIFAELDQGVYRLSEVAAPAGYIADFDPVTFTVSNTQHRDYQYTAENQSTGVHLTKVEQGLMRATEAEVDAFIADNPGFDKVQVGSYFNAVRNLPGASFAIYHTVEANGQLIADVESGPVEIVTTGENGLATSTTPLDSTKTYAVVETQAPSGYHAVTNPYFFRLADLKANAAFDGIVRVTIPNDAQTGKVTIAKHTGETGQVLPGVTFELYQRAPGATELGTLVDTKVTGQNGIAMFTGLELGAAYTLVETDAPDGYALAEPIDVGVLEAPMTDKTFVVYDYELELRFDKTDQRGAPLPGAQFGLYADEQATTAISTATSDAQGVVSFGRVDAGTYIVRELVAPQGYVLDETLYQVELAPTGDIRISHPTLGEVDAIVNEPVVVTPAVAQIEARKTLEGATLTDGQFSFELRDVDGTVIETATNNAAGAVTFTAISYDSVGDYEYTITEVLGSDQGVTYDQTEHRVTVQVREANYVLTATVVYADDATPTFINTFTPPHTPTPTPPPPPPDKPSNLPKTGGLGCSRGEHS